MFAHPDATLSLAVLLGCSLVPTAVVSALESALVLLPEDGHRILRRRNLPRGRQLERLLQERRETTRALLYLDALLNLLVFLLLFLLVRQWQDWGLIWQVTAGVGLFAFSVLVGEIMPKILARLNPLRTLELSLGPALFLLGMLRPFSRWWQALETRLARVEVESPEQVKAPEHSDLLALVEIAREQKSLLEPEADLLRELLALGREKAAHVMTPRVDCFMLPDDLSDEQAAALLRTRRYRRVPVYGETPDDLLGVLDVPRFLQSLRRPGGPSFLEQLEPPAFIPETMPALELLQSFLLRRRRVALLLDEYGGFSGLVTLSDLLEELLGQERPDSSSGLYLEKIRPDAYLASGQVRMDDLRQALQWPPQANEPETLAGYLLAQHGSVPRPGTEFALQGWRATIRRSSRNRIKEVYLEKQEASA